MLASDKGRESKWVPWELGFADGKKDPSSIAILPVQETDGDWKGSEYIGLYPTIQEFVDEDWRVVEPGASVLMATTLKDWLATRPSA